MQNQEAEIRAIVKKYNGISYCLNERGRRLWAAVEAESYGRGGIALISRATGISNKTIHKGLKELKDPTTGMGCQLSFKNSQHRQ